MIDRDSLYKTFFGGRPPPPPWATDCPIRFEVWLAFAERVQSVGLREAAAALETTQPALRKRLPEEFLGSKKVGRTWEIPVAEIRAKGGELSPDTSTQANLADHPRVDVILGVSDEFGPAKLLDQLRGEGGLPSLSFEANLVAAGSYVVASITFADLIQTIIPLTNLARKIRSAQSLDAQTLTRALEGKEFDLSPEQELLLPDSAIPELSSWEARQLEARHHERVAHLAWFLNVLAAVAGLNTRANDAVTQLIRTTNQSPATEPADMGTAKVIDRRRRHPVQTVNLNRTARPAVTRSRITIKADAAEQLFSVDTSALTWAVVDSGIDAHHPAFAVRDEKGIPIMMAEGSLAQTRVTRAFSLLNRRQVLASDLAQNGLVNWAQAIPHVELQPPVPPPGDVPDTRNDPWSAPLNPHGTHVAGILAADWPDNELQGICPALRLYDFRVLDREGKGDEFSIVAALQLIRHVNEQAGRLVIVGVNLSLSVPLDVANHSTGWTPVCMECDRLTRSGVVVVASAGNAGFEGGFTTIGLGYNTVSISDPGNTDSIITVGSTHRSDPHRHGVSYFSSRGPTADGRQKPDLLAPGEDIDGPVPGIGLQAMHGTSQAAAHVSGAAAMLMARYRELIGRPERVKEILCRTATDLGRERAFQGHGLVDALRAMQSI